MGEHVYLASFDGSTRPEDQRSTIGFAIEAVNSKNILCKSYRPVDFGTSIEVEYKALIELLRTAIGLRIKRIRIKGDCKVVIDQVTGEVATENLALSSLRDQVLKLLQGFDYYELMWVPRDNNQLADRLSRASLKRKSLKKRSRRK